MRAYIHSFCLLPCVSVNFHFLCSVLFPPENYSRSSNLGLGCFFVSKMLFSFLWTSSLVSSFVSSNEIRKAISFYFLCASIERGRKMLLSINPMMMLFWFDSKNKASCFYFSEFQYSFVLVNILNPRNSCESFFSKNFLFVLWALMCKYYEELWS